MLGNAVIIECCALCCTNFSVLGALIHSRAEPRQGLWNWRHLRHLPCLWAAPVVFSSLHSYLLDGKVLSVSKQRMMFYLALVMKVTERKAEESHMSTMPTFRPVNWLGVQGPLFNSKSVQWAHCTSFALVTLYGILKEHLGLGARMLCRW